MGRPRKTGGDLPQRVYLKRGAYYYEVASTRKWVRLGASLPEALEAHRVLIARMAMAPPPAKFNSLSDHVKWGPLANRLFANAKGGAKVRSLPFEIELSHVIDLLVKADGRCSLTGIPFDQEVLGKAGRRPWSASLDRQDSRRGYVDGNVRVVCLSVNIALMDYGDAVLDRIGRALSDKRNAAEKSDPESTTCDPD